jgi:threonine/homoserine/homoserine lactone efflux protein
VYHGQVRGTEARVGESLLVGVSLGLGAGLTPGPMTAVVVALTLERGLRAGVQAACAPLITDGPILLLALWALRFFPQEAYSALAVAGGGFLVLLGLRAAGGEAPRAEGDVREVRLGSLRRAVVANFLNPSPYLFWSTVGGPLVREAWARSPGAAVAFLLSFFALLVGSKAALAWAVAAGSRRLTEASHRRLGRLAGWLLVLTGLLLATRAVGGAL